MKEKIPTGVFVAIIVVAVALIGVVGYKFVFGGSGSKKTATDMSKIINEHGGGVGATHTTGGSMMGGRPGSYSTSSGSSSYSNYMRSGSSGGPGGSGGPGRPGGPPVSGGR